MKPPPLALGRHAIRAAMVEAFRQVPAGERASLPARESETLNPIA